MEIACCGFDWDFEQCLKHVPDHASLCGHDGWCAHLWWKRTGSSLKRDKIVTWCGWVRGSFWSCVGPLFSCLCSWVVLVIVLGGTCRLRVLYGFALCWVLLSWLGFWKNVFYFWLSWETTIPVAGNVMISVVLFSLLSFD